MIDPNERVPALANAAMMGSAFPEKGIPGVDPSSVTTCPLCDVARCATFFNFMWDWRLFNKSWHIYKRDSAVPHCTPWWNKPLAH